jgi:hypothetical protein
MVIVIGSPKAEWIEFLDKISAGDIVSNVVFSIREDKKVHVEEIAQDNTAIMKATWTPKTVTGEGDITINPEKIKKAIHALPDAGPITGEFDGAIAVFKGAKRYVKFKLPEAGERKDISKIPKFDKHLVELEIDAKVIEQNLSNGIQATEMESPRYEFVYEGSVLTAKIGDFASDGNEMGFPLATSLAKGTGGEEKFSSSFNDTLREILKIGGKMKVSLGSNYPAKLVSKSPTVEIEYIIAPAIPKE